jgi:Holliday junction DNA helicase RuvA
VIAFVRGTIAEVGVDSAVVDVGGIGIEVRATPATLAELKVGAPATLPTSLVVREEALTLYGFSHTDERTVFELLQTASGVGPRLAQAILAVLSPDEVRRAVATEDVAALTKVPGIGKKGAQRIVLELKDRLGAPSGTAAADAGGASPSAVEGAWREQVRQALIGLGWSAREADGAVDAVAGLAAEQAKDGGPDVSALLRAALRSLSRS